MWGKNTAFAAWTNAVFNYSFTHNLLYTKFELGFVEMKAMVMMGKISPLRLLNS